MVVVEVAVVVVALVPLLAKEDLQLALPGIELPNSTLVSVHECYM